MTTRKKRLKPGPKPHPDGPYRIMAINVREKLQGRIQRAANDQRKSVSAYVRGVLSGVLERRR